MPVKHQSFLELSRFVGHNRIADGVGELETDDNQQRRSNTGSEIGKPPKRFTTFAKHRQSEGSCRSNNEKDAFVLGPAGTTCKESGGRQHAQRRRIGSSLKIERD